MVGGLDGGGGGSAKLPMPIPIPQKHQQAASVFDVIKSWLLCGWLTNEKFYKPGYVEVDPTKNDAAMGGNYVRPSRWTLFVRKCRARWRKSPGCFEPGEKNPMHYYKTESYERNFDRGREYWEDLPMIEDDSSEWGIPVPDPVWMITASQEDMKKKAAEIAKARRGEN